MIIPPRRTKIIATIGPACWEDQQILQLIQAGADALRVNTSHLTPRQAEDLYRRLDAICSNAERPVALLVDLQGPKLRLAKDIRPREIQVDQPVQLAETGHVDDDEQIGVDIPAFVEQINIGQKLVLGDGAPVLSVTRIEGHRIIATAEHAGELRPGMGVLLPGGGQSLPALTDRDKQHLSACAPYADYVALSFVRSAAEMRGLRQLLEEHSSQARTVAKIERAEALDNLQALVAEADAVMIARGDLGLEIGLAQVPFAQREILRHSQAGLTCAITATQVLESMLHAPQPTRAEVTDIAHAIQEGTSALMLSEETAIGEHPAHTVATMADLIHQVERRLPPKAREIPVKGDPRASLVRAADQLGADMQATKLIVPTDSGETARYAAALARQHVYALARHERVRRQLALERGVHPIPWDGQHGTYLPVTAARWVQRAGYLEANEPVVVAWGEFSRRETTDWVQVIAALSLKD